MKRSVFVVVLFALVSCTLFGAGYVADVDGFFWTELSSEAKVFMVCGYLIGMNAVSQFTAEIYVEAMRMERSETVVAIMMTVKKIGTWTEYPATVNDMVKGIDLYYMTPGNLTTPVYKLIPVLFKGKE